MNLDLLENVGKKAFYEGVVESFLTRIDPVDQSRHEGELENAYWKDVMNHFRQNSMLDVSKDRFDVVSERFEFRVVDVKSFAKSDFGQTVQSGVHEKNSWIKSFSISLARLSQNSAAEIIRIYAEHFFHLLAAFDEGLEKTATNGFMEVIVVACRKTFGSSIAVFEERAVFAENSFGDRSQSLLGSHDERRLDELFIDESAGELDFVECVFHDLIVSDDINAKIGFVDFGKTICSGFFLDVSEVFALLCRKFWLVASKIGLVFVWKYG